MLEALQNLLTTVISAIPSVIGFLLILIIGFIVAKILTKVIAKLLDKVGFNKLVAKGGMKFDAAAITGKVIFYVLMLFVLSAAFGVFGPTNPVSVFLAAIIAYIPLVLVAIVIVVIAAAIAAAAKGLIQNSLGELSYGKILANIVSGLILAVGVIAALNQLGIAENIVNGIFYAFLVAVVGIAIVAVGGGGITPMKSRWEGVLAKYDEEKPKIAEQVAKAPSVKEQGEQAKQAAQAKSAGNGQEPPKAPPSQSPPRPAMASPDGRPASGAHRP